MKNKFMGAYQYQAIKKSGAACTGVIDADSERHARSLLREQGFIPTHIQPMKQRQIMRQKNSLSAQDLALLTRQLATLIAAGIPIDEALQGVAEQSEKDQAKQILIAVRSKVLEGFALAQAMESYPSAFPTLYQATIRAGEHTGRLDLVLEKLADYTETQQQTRHKIQQALIYPSLMIFISTAIISFLLSFVVPKIIAVFSDSGQALPYMTQVLIYLSDFLQKYGCYLLLFLFVSGVVFYRALKRPHIRFFWHRCLLKCPVIGELIKSVNISRYIHTFSILFASGVNVLETMHVSASLVEHLVIRRALEQAAVRVKEGVAISTALQETSFFAAMSTHLISSGEKSGQLAPMMERAALHLDQEVRRKIDTGLTLLEPFIILFMGGVVLFIVLSTLLPIFSMDQLV